MCVLGEGWGTAHPAQTGPLARLSPWGHLPSAHGNPIVGFWSAGCSLGGLDTGLGWVRSLLPARGCSCLPGGGARWGLGGVCGTWNAQRWPFKSSESLGEVWKCQNESGLKTHVLFCLLLSLEQGSTLRKRKMYEEFLSKVSILGQWPPPHAQPHPRPVCGPVLGGLLQPRASPACWLQPFPWSLCAWSSSLGDVWGWDMDTCEPTQAWLTCVHPRGHAHTHVCIHNVRLHTCIYSHRHAHTRVHTGTLMHTHVCICTGMTTHVHAHTRAHTPMENWVVAPPGSVILSQSLCALVPCALLVCPSAICVTTNSSSMSVSHFMF